MSTNENIKRIYYWNYFLSAFAHSSSARLAFGSLCLGTSGFVLGIFIFMAGQIFEVTTLFLGVIGILQKTKGQITEFLRKTISNTHSTCLLYFALF
ncbi:hypothetical protein [Synechococcus sp. MIT S9503]|uniref:hypothetical protein n=1 Tax=Synechococcus sp. MIT S9503 TaxID=3082547 RepID=UPI0039A648DA